MRLMDEVIGIVRPRIAALGITSFYSTRAASETWKSEHYPLIAVEAAYDAITLNRRLATGETALGSTGANPLQDAASIYVLVKATKTDGMPDWVAARASALAISSSVLDLLGQSLDFGDGNDVFELRRQAGLEDIHQVLAYSVKITVIRQTVRNRVWEERAAHKALGL